MLVSDIVLIIMIECKKNPKEKSGGENKGCPTAQNHALSFTTIECMTDWLARYSWASFAGIKLSIN